MEDINSRIKIALKEKGMTQKELSEKSCVTEAAISRYVNGNRCPTLRVAAQIADALDVSLDWLAGR